MTSDLRENTIVFNVADVFQKSDSVDYASPKLGDDEDSTSVEPPDQEGKRETVHDVVTLL